MTHLIESGLTDDLDNIEALLPRLASFDVPLHRQPAELWHGDRELIRAWASGKRPDVRVWVVRGDQGLLGVCVISTQKELLTHAPSAHLEVLAVCESAEGQGVASALLTVAESEARELGAEMMSLHVFANNARARRLYEKSGFDGEILRYVKQLVALSDE